MTASEPTGKLDVVIEATPEINAAFPSEVAPLKNWTFPVGNTEDVPALATDAEMVTGCPATDAVGEADAATVLGSRCVRTTSLPVPPA